MKIIIENADSDDFNELSKLAREGKIHTFCMTDEEEWIPVSERLPEDRDWYLGVFKEPDTGFIGIPYICDYVGGITKGTTKEGWILRGLTDIDNASEYYKSLECVAWQPLPEPYKKGDTE